MKGGKGGNGKGRKGDDAVDPVVDTQRHGACHCHHDLRREGGASMKRREGGREGVQSERTETERARERKRAHEQGES